MSYDPSLITEHANSNSLMSYDDCSEHVSLFISSRTCTSRVNDIHVMRQTEKLTHKEIPRFEISPMEISLISSRKWRREKSTQSVSAALESLGNYSSSTTKQKQQKKLQVINFRLAVETNLFLYRNANSAYLKSARVPLVASPSAIQMR